jgi:hypothetical protein
VPQARRSALPGVKMGFPAGLPNCLSHHVRLCLIASLISECRPNCLSHQVKTDMDQKAEPSKFRQSFASFVPDQFVQLYGKGECG